MEPEHHFEDRRRLPSWICLPPNTRMEDARMSMWLALAVALVLSALAMAAMLMQSRRVRQRARRTTVDPRGTVGQRRGREAR
jgi:hypothetical protein